MVVVWQKSIEKPIKRNFRTDIEEKVNLVFSPKVFGWLVPYEWSHTPTRKLPTGKATGEAILLGLTETKKHLVNKNFARCFLIYQGISFGGRAK